MKEKFSSDPLDPARLYEKYSWTNERVFAHKVIAVRSKIDGSTSLKVLPDSAKFTETEDFKVVKFYEEAELLHTTAAGNEIEHVNKARSGIVNQRVDLENYPNMPVSIPGKFRAKTETK